MPNNHKPPFCWCHDDTIPDDESDAAPQEPQDGDSLDQHDAEDSITWDELLYALTEGAMGTKPQDG